MDISVTGGPLTHHHRAFVDGDCATIPWGAFDAGAHDPRTRERARRAWVLRTNDEYRSMVGFAELQSLTAEMRAPLDVIVGAGRVVRDETLHVELCARLTDLLGGRGPKAPAPRFVGTDARAPARRRALQHLVGSLCIGETISVAMLAGVRERATDAVAHAVLTQLLRDESFHSRFGWLWLPHFEVTDAERRWLDALVPRVLASVTRGAVPSQHEAGVYRDNPYGSMPVEARRAALERSLDEIVERFEAAGLPAERWRDEAAALR